MTDQPSNRAYPGSALPFARVIAPTLTVHAGGSATTFGTDDLHERVQAFASRLRGQGIAARTLLAISVPDPVDQVVGFLGAITAGAVPCLLPPPDRTDEHGHWARQALVLAGAELETATLDGRIRLLADDALYVQRTSGTGRQAAAIVIARDAAAASVFAAARHMSAGPGEVTVGWLPLHHDYGLMGQILIPMAVDGSSVLISASDWMRDPALLLSVVSERGGTHTYMPAFGFRRCVDKVDPDGDYDLSSWRTVNCAGEPIAPDVLPAFEAMGRAWGLRPGAVTVAYGMAEVVAGASCGWIDDGYRIDTVAESTLTAQGLAEPASRGREVVSCGTPFDCLELAVVDHVGTPCPERVVGEVALRGSTLGELLTETGTEPLPTTDHGWFRTGDQGYLADGEVYVVDRIKDLIVVGGVNIHPTHIERTAMAVVPAVRRAAAFAVPDPTAATEHPVLLLERPRAPLDELAALRAVRRSLLGIGVAAREVRFVDPGAIAVTTSGKIRRQVTRAAHLAVASTDGVPASMDIDWLDIVRDVTGAEWFEPQITLEALGIDSLALYELLSALETALRVEIDPKALVRVRTIGDLGVLVGTSCAGERTPNAAPAGQPSSGPSRPSRSARPTPTRTPTPTPTRAAARQWHRLRRAVRRGPVVGPVHLPLRPGTALHVAATTTRLRLRGELDPGVRETVDLAEAIGGHDLDEVARTSLMANTWQRWRFEAATAALRRSERAGSRSGPGGRRSPVRISGAAHLADAVAAERGVILVAPHVPLAAIVSTLPELERRRFRLIEARGNTTVDRAGQLRRAERILRTGGAIMILADELIGSGGITIDIAGKERPLRPGFARLARSTDAEVVPVFPSYDPSGRFDVDLRPPMAGRTEHDLLTDYGDMLRAFWHEHPGSLTWSIVGRHLRLSA